MTKKLSVGRPTKVDAVAQAAAHPTPMTAHKKYVPGVANLFIGDVHYGAGITDVDTEGDNVYNPRVALCRTKAAFDELLSRSAHEAKGGAFSVCVIWLGGDIIEGFRTHLVHNTGDENDASDPLRNADRYSLFFFMQLKRLEAAGFAEVIVNVVPGNHGKMTRREKIEKELVENLDTAFSQNLEIRCESFNDLMTGCEFKIRNATSSGLVMMEQHGIPFVMCHGDNEGFELGQKGKSGGALFGRDETRRGARSYRQALVQSFKKRASMRDNVFEGSPPDWDRLVLLFAGRHASVPCAEEGVIGCGALRGVDKYAIQRQAIFELEAPSALFWVVWPEGMGYVQQLAVNAGEKPSAQTSSTGSTYRFLDWDPTVYANLKRKKAA